MAIPFAAPIRGTGVVGGSADAASLIVAAACQVAERTLLDQRLFLVTESQSQALLDMPDRPTEDNAGLKELFSRRAPWGN